MPKGLKETSSLIQISSSVSETAPNTFTSIRVPLTLNALDNEVLVVYAIDVNASSPDVNGNLASSVSASVSTTSRTTVGSIANSNVMAIAQHNIRNDGVSAVGFTQYAPESPTGAGLTHIAIIATNDFFVNIEGFNNLIEKDCQVRLYCARARADASTYASLVQSELLSS